MNLRQIEIYLAVVEQGSFSAAAKALLLTQSTVSQHIASLEAEMKVQLLERSRNGIRQTEAGRLLLRHARRLAGELRATEDAFHRFRGLEESTLRVGASTIPGTYLLPPVLAALRARSRSLHMVVVPGDSRETAERIVNREVEVGVLGSRLEERVLHLTEVGHDQIRLVVHPGHPWAKRHRVPLAELVEGEFVGREPGSGTGQAIHDALKRAGLEPERLQVYAEFGTSEAIKSSVLSGVGVAFLPDLAIRRETERGELIAVDVEGLMITRPFYLARQAGRELSPAPQAFWDLMLATYTGRPAS